MAGHTVGAGAPWWNGRLTFPGLRRQALRCLASDWTRSLPHRLLRLLRIAFLLLPVVVPGWPAVALGLDRVVVGTLTYTSAAPLFIAQERDYFAEQGIAVELRFFEAATPIAEAVAAGEADFGLTGLTAGVYRLAGGGALRIIAAQSREEPGYRFVAYIASNQAFADGLTEPAALRGRRVGITQPGSSMHYMAGLLADRLGFGLAEITLVPLDTVANLAQAVRDGTVDAVMLPANQALPLEAAGDARIIGWVADYTPWQVGALFTSTEHVGADSDLVGRFVHAYLAAVADYAAAFQQRDASGAPVFGEAAEALIPIIRRSVRPEPSAEQLRAGIPYIDPQARLWLSDIDRQLRWFQDLGLVDPGIRAADIVDLRFTGGVYEPP